MLATLAFETPVLDYAALAPLIVLASGAVLLILIDVIALERAKPFMSIVAGATLRRVARRLRLTLGATSYGIFRLNSSTSI